MFTVQQCPRCDRVLQPDDVVCPRCGQVSPWARQAAVRRFKAWVRVHRKPILAVTVGLVALLLGGLLFARVSAQGKLRALEGVWGWANRPQPVPGANVKLLRIAGDRFTLYHGVVMAGRVLPGGAVPVAEVRYRGQIRLRRDGLEVILPRDCVLPNERGMFLEAFTANGQFWVTPARAPDHLRTTTGQVLPEVFNTPEGVAIQITYQRPIEGIALTGYRATYPMRLEDGTRLVLRSPQPRRSLRLRDDAIGIGVAPIEEIGAVERLSLEFLPEIVFTKDWKAWQWVADTSGGDLRSVRFYR